MECHSCGRRVERVDRFCNGCGTSLQGVTDTTQVVAVVDDETDSTPAAATPAPEGGDPSGDRPGTNDERPPPEPTITSELEATELVAETGDDIWDEEPRWAPTGQVPTVAGSGGTTVSTADLPATEPITEVWMDAAGAGAATDPTTPDQVPGEMPDGDRVEITDQIVAQQPAATTAMPVVATVTTAEAPRVRFRFNVVLLISLVTGVVALVGLFADVLTITSDIRLQQTPDTPAEFRTGTWIVDDLADNLSIAGLIAIVAIVAGGVASGFRWRWGSGLAGGAGLALAGLAAVTLGLAQLPIDIAHAFARVPSEDPFVLTITRDLGYWLLVAAGALGVVLFFASTNDALGDRRAGLNPWIAALGALAIVVTAAGPLLPENQAVFSDNWYLVEGVGEPSALLLVARLVQLGLLLLGGVIGFLSVRRWGLGVAAGVALPPVWLVVSALFDLTEQPVGLGFRNPGGMATDVHGVTIIGTSAILAMLVLGIVAAYDQGVRERR